MKNTRCNVKMKKIIQIRNHYKNNGDVLLIELDGKNTLGYQEYIANLSGQIDNSTAVWINFSSYDDTMRRPYTYFNKSEVIILIYNYSLFLSEDLKTKKMIEHIFDNSILPFFEEEIENCVVGGKRMKYNIYYSM